MKKCSVEECQKQSRSVGMCMQHYSKKRMYGDPNKTVNFTSKTGMCELDNCSEKHYAKRYCKKHYKQTLKFNLSFEEYSKKIKESFGLCAICKKEEINNNRTLSIDHNHQTGQVRGILCDTCNMGLGLFMDNKELLKQAIVYLGKWE